MTESTENVLSSFGYNAAGVIAFTQAEPVLGVGFNLLGIGSALFHYYEPEILAAEAIGEKSSKKWTQRLDEITMYLAYVPLVVYSFALPDWFAIAAGIVVACFFRVLDSHKFLPAIIAVGLVATYFNHHGFRAILSAVNFALAIAARFNHPLWHLISAWASYIWIIAL